MVALKVYLKTIAEHFKTKRSVAAKVAERAEILQALSFEEAKGIVSELQSTNAELLPPNFPPPLDKDLPVLGTAREYITQPHWRQMDARERHFHNTSRLRSQPELGRWRASARHENAAG